MTTDDEDAARAKALEALKAMLADLDAAHADAIEVVRRAQVRQGRRVFSNHDGKTVRQVYELLRSVMGPDGGADNDASFQ